MNTHDWTPEQHHAEAQHLTNLARQPVITGWLTGFRTHNEVAALALLHATMALYRPAPSGTEELK
jgi:hypothetical protein